MEYGIVGLLILALDIWALLSVWGSGSSTGGKIIWSLIILILPYSPFPGGVSELFW